MGGSSADCGGGSDRRPMKKRNIYKPNTALYNSPRSSQIKQRKLYEELCRAKIEKELALAAYLRAKTVKVELENVKLKHGIELLKKQCSKIEL